MSEVRKVSGVDMLTPDETGLVSIRVDDAYNVNLQFVEATGEGALLRGGDGAAVRCVQGCVPRAYVDAVRQQKDIFLDTAKTEYVNIVLASDDPKSYNVNALNRVAEECRDELSRYQKTERTSLNFSNIVTEPGSSTGSRTSSPSTSRRTMSFWTRNRRSSASSSLSSS